MLNINFNPGDLFLLLFAFGDNVMGCVVLKYKFGFEFGFYKNIFDGDFCIGWVIFLELSFEGSGFKIGSFLGISNVFFFSTFGTSLNNSKIFFVLFLVKFPLEVCFNGS